MDNYYADTLSPALTSTERATFIRRTYQHLAGSVCVFTVLSGLLFTSGVSETLARVMTGGRWSWLIVLGLFMLVSTVANRWASSSISLKTQYAGLGIYIVAEAIIFAPLLYIAGTFYEGLLTKAAMVTGGLFLGLTWVAFASKKDFSFMGGFLKVGCMVALGLIVAGILFDFNLGLWFSSAMILLVGGMLLYQTSAVIRHYHTSQYVAASLALFASLATLFWYVIRIFMSSRD